MADLPITSDDGATPVVITGAASPFSTIAVNANGSFHTFADNVGAGTVAALNGAVIATTNGCGSVIFNTLGTWVGTLTFQGTVDGTNWFVIYGISVGTDLITEFISSNGAFEIPCGGMAQVELIATAWTSGTANIAWDAGAGGKTVIAVSPVAAAFQATVTGTVVTQVASVITTGSLSTVGITAVQLHSASIASVTGVTIRSALANTGIIYVGPSTVTANTAAATDGMPIKPGESITLAITNINLIYLIATVAAQEVFWIVL